MEKFRWELWIDRGGTFTDIVARNPQGRIISHKLLSDNPECYQDAVVEGIQHILHLKPTATIPTKQIKAIKRRCE